MNPEAGYSSVRINPDYRLEDYKDELVELFNLPTDTTNVEQALKKKQGMKKICYGCHKLVDIDVNTCPLCNYDFNQILL